MLVHRPDRKLESVCNCSAPSEQDVCSHGLALYLRLIRWPLQQLNISHAFDAYPWVAFFQQMARKFSQLKPADQPHLNLPEGVLPSRLTDYLGFSGDVTALVSRDRKCLLTAKNRARSESERVLLQRQMPSARLSFEESPLYSLSKLMFYLEMVGPFVHRVSLQPDHRVRITVTQGDHDVLTWEMALHTFLKASKDTWSFWEPVLGFEVRRQAISLQYRIAFAAGNALEIEAVIPLGNGEFVTQEQVKIPGPGSLCHHESIGYFQTQTGLSPFEMTYCQKGIHRIAPDEVKQFLKAHKDTLESLDRELMDEGLFEQLVTPHFQNFELTLEHYQEGQFQIGLQASLGGIEFNLPELRALFSQKTRYAKAGGKLFDTLGYDAIYLKPILESMGEPPTLSITDLFRFMAFFRERLQINTTPLTQEIYEALRGESLPEPPALDHTQLDLRPYQHLGYQWLHFLQSFGLGGLLCDQMGLGKTHQGMALLAATLAESPKARVLVIAPTSVLFHWRQKIASFCPQTRQHLHHGPNRASLAGISPGQVILTSYGTARNDANELADQLWDLIIFDEVQTLKNKRTKAFEAIARIKSRCRIGLTGTPLENHLGELKSLLDLVMPGYLGSDHHFKRYFVDPIIKVQHKGTLRKLRHMVAPFILRRAKTEVLKELPDKIEDRRDYEIDEYERDLYEQIRTQGKAEMEGEQGAGPPAVMHIFQIINKLKQACNHPALYFGNTDYRAYPSTKWSMFTELVEETIASGEKCVVFTQYLGMVDIICQYLRHSQIEFASVTGATRDREAEQGRFQNDPNCRVFVGTLKAAGVGIDLTAASILIHYDRWWNPAREEQATDRIHRFGQKKHVQIYKFRGLKTVEERIDRIIDRKKHLLEDLVSFDSSQTSKLFTVDELLEILA